MVYPGSPQWFEIQHVLNQQQAQLAHAAAEQARLRDQAEQQAVADEQARGETAALFLLRAWNL